MLSTYMILSDLKMKFLWAVIDTTYRCHYRSCDAPEDSISIRTVEVTFLQYPHPSPSRLYISLQIWLGEEEPEGKE